MLVRRRLTAIVASFALALPVAFLHAQDGGVPSPPAKAGGGDPKKTDDAPKKDGAPKKDDAPPKKDDAKKDDGKKEDDSTPPASVKLETKTPVIALAIRTREGEAVQPNMAQYACFECCALKLGFVVESRLEAPYDKPHDKWIRKQLEKLLPKKPDPTTKIECPTAAFFVDATISLTFKPTKFYDKEVTNNFEGVVDGSITDGDGKKLKDLSFKYYFGQTPQTPKDDVRKQTEMVCAYCILHHLFNLDGFAAKVPADKKAEYEKQLKFLKEQNDKREKGQQKQ